MPDRQQTVIEWIAEHPIIWAVITYSTCFTTGSLINDCFDLLGWTGLPHSHLYWLSFSLAFPFWLMLWLRVRQLRRAELPQESRP